MHANLKFCSMKISEEVREFARLQNQPAGDFVAAEEAEAGMAEMSKVYDGAEGAQAPDANERREDKRVGSFIWG
jgi:phosphomethylpyrimidine synthase